MDIKNTNQKGYSFPTPIILGVLIILGLGAGMYYFSSKQTVNQQNNPAAVVASQTPTPSPTLKDEAVDWKIYTNTDNNFSLKYPKQFTLKVNHTLAKDMAYRNEVGNAGLYQLWFYATEEGAEKFSGYSIDLYTSSNKTLAEQFPNKSLELLSGNYGADEAGSVNFKSNEPGTINENFTIQYFRVKDTFFVITPILQDVSATDKIWNYPVLKTLYFE